MIEHFWNVFFQIKITSAFVKSFPSDRRKQLFPFRTNRKQKRLQRRDGRLDLDCKQDVGIPIFRTQTSRGAHVSCMWVCQGLGAFFRWMTVRNPQKTGGFHFRVAWFRDFILKFVQIRKVEKFWTISSRHHRWQLFLVWVKKKSKLSGFAFKCILASCMFFHIIHGSWFVILFFSLGVSHSWPSWLPPSKLPHQK